MGVLFYREKMIISHQNQIEQLRNSFREKLNSAEGNSSGVGENFFVLRLIIFPDAVVLYIRAEYLI